MAQRRLQDSLSELWQGHIYTRNHSQVNGTRVFLNASAVSQGCCQSCYHNAIYLTVGCQPKHVALLMSSVWYLGR